MRITSQLRRTAKTLAATSKALAVIGTPADAEVIDAVWVRGALIVATRQPSSPAFEFAVDAFRLPTPAETDPEQTDSYTPGEWILVDQHGDHSGDEVPRMIADTVAYLRELFPPKALAA